MANQTTEIKRFEESTVDSVLNRIGEYQKNGGLKIPANYSAENALRSAWLILQDTKDKDKNPVLQSCTRESIANAMFRMVTQGLDPVKNQCYFVAYGKNLTLMRSYMGTMAVAKRTANVKSVVANVVFEGDEFHYEVDPETGLKKIIKHVQKLDDLSPDKIKGAYALVTLNDDTKIMEAMNIQQIKKSWLQSMTKGGSDTHKNFGDEMAKRTVINRTLKLLINSSDDSHLFEKEDETEDVAYTEVQEEIRENANKEEVSMDPEPTEQTETKPEPEKPKAKHSQPTMQGPGF